MKPIPFTALLLTSLLFNPAIQHTAAQNDPFGSGTEPAQAAPKQGGGKGKKPSNPGTPADGNPRFDIEFFDTPVSDACDFISDQLERAGGEALNIVVSKNAGDIVLPSMKLRQITFDQFASFINRIGGAPGSNSADPFAGEEGGFIPQHSGQRFGISDSDGIWYFWADEPKQSEETHGEMAGLGELTGLGGGMAMAGNPPPQIDTRVFPLHGEVEPTLGLIEEALAETHQHTKRSEPALKFHEPSKTLIVTGTASDIAMIESVISVMKQRQDMEREQEEQSFAKAMQREVEELHHTLEMQARNAEEEKQRISSRADKVIAELETQLIEMRSKYTELHPQVIQLEAELERALADKKAAK